MLKAPNETLSRGNCCETCFKRFTPVMETTNTHSAREQVLTGLGCFPSLSIPETRRLVFPPQLPTSTHATPRDRGRAELPRRGRGGSEGQHTGHGRGEFVTSAGRLTVSILGCQTPSCSCWAEQPGSCRPRVSQAPARIFSHVYEKQEGDNCK